MILSRGRVSAQGHQIFDSGLMELLQQGFDFQACVGNTGQMGHCLNAQIVLDVGGEFMGIFPGGTSSPVGHGDEIRMIRPEFLKFYFKAFQALLSFRRIDFNRKNKGFLTVQFSDFHWTSSPIEGIGFDFVWVS